MTKPDVAFARSSIGGKKSAKVEGRCSDELKFDLQRKCHELGVSESEYVERLIAVSLYGVDHVLMMDRKRTEMVCGLSALAQREGGAA